MEQLERRQAKLRFKMNILDQLEEKRKKYEEMRQREEDMIASEEKERTYKSQVVEEARRRLLMEHAAALTVFLPKGVIQKLQDMDVFETGNQGGSRNLDAARESMKDYGDLRRDEDRIEPDGFQHFSSRPSPRRVDFSSRVDEDSREKNDEDIPVHLRSTRPW